MDASSAQPAQAVQGQDAEDPRDVALRETLEFHHYDLVDAKLLRALIDEAAITRTWFGNLGIDVDSHAGAPGSFGKYSLRQLADKFTSLGGEIKVNTTVTKILKDANGKVTGVLTTDKDGKNIQIKTGSVVLASGGFTGNPVLLKKYFPYYSSDTISSEASPTNTGSGIQLASDAGAALADYATLIKENGFSFKSGSSISNRLAMQASVWINKRGERFIDETTGRNNESTNALVGQPGMKGYALFDDSQIVAMGTGAGPGNPAQTGGKTLSLKEKMIAEAASSGVWLKISDSLDGIATWIGADPKVLKATIDEYNSFCEKGRDAALGKDKRSLRPLGKGPYYALRFGPLMIDTVGPVKINAHMEVLDKQGKPIPGFYAAGVITSGWQGRDYHLFGSALGLSAAGGRIAGANAAEHSLGH